MKSIKKRTVFFVINVAIPLVIGLLLYLFIRKDSFISGAFERISGISVSVHLENVDSKIIVRFIRNYLADIIWAYAVTSALLLIHDTAGYSELKIVLICLTVELIMEVIQVVNPFFTFDWIDILVEFIATGTAWLAYRQFRI